MDIKEQIAVMQHYANGGKVEVSHKSSHPIWGGCMNPSWDWRTLDYRIKKEPRKFKIWYHKTDGCVWSYVPSQDVQPFINAGWELIMVTEDV